MSKKELTYLESVHRYGRIWGIIVGLVLLCFPLAVSLIFKASPNYPVLLKGILATAPMYWAVGAIETVTFVPMLGAGGSYLSFVTGNISNLKLPCALNALEQNEVSANSEEGEVVSTIAIAVSSNLQGAATLVGDTTAIMLGSALDMSFLDFIFYNGKPGMFFMVELGAVLSACIVYFTFRKEKGAIPKSGKMTEVEDIVPTVLLVGAIVLLIVASFLPFELPAETNGLICSALLVIGLIYNYIRNKNLDAIMGPLKAIDLETLGLLVGLFLMIGGISNMGVIDALAALLAKLGAGSPFLMYTIIVWASVAISAFIDNIPYVATMIPVIAGLAVEMGIDSTALYFGLLSGATLGGNCTPIGASANIAGIGILRKEGYDVKNGDFFKIGIPFTLSAIVPAYILIWILFHP